jgi:hypothetical protein
MRGLKAWLMLLQARSITAVSGVNTVEKICDFLIEAYLEAQSLGFYDAMKGISNPPKIFCGEPELTSWWVNGQERFWLFLPLTISK